MPPLDRLPLPLKLYRAATRAGVPLVPLWLGYRRRRGKEHPERLRERRGESRIARPSGSLVWIHVASVGELNAVLPLIERLQNRADGVLVTSGTLTSAALAEKRLPRSVIHQFVPLDLPQFAARFLDTWKPNLALFVESDLWPNLILGCADRDIPLILLNGRLSERSFRRWQRASYTIGALLGRFDLCLAQSSDDAARFAALGAPRISTTGNLKLDVPATHADPEQIEALAQATRGRTIVAAVSTHPGEEAIVVDAHRRLKADFPNLLTLIAPRHPERGQGIADIVKAAALTPALRTRGEAPDRRTDIYVVDTIGELGLVYTLAPIVFVGGSLVRHGGQNPIEPARFGAAILHGPHVGNFASIYQALDEAKAAERVDDATQLAQRIGVWLREPQTRQAVADRAERTLDTMVGALDRTFGALDPYLMQFGLSRVDHA